MNKSDFAVVLNNKLKYSKSDCNIIVNILEDNLLNKEVAIKNLMEKLNITETEAKNVYDTCINIISSLIIFKIKHPFRKNT